MNKNDIVELQITDITADGSGVGKYNGFAVFIPETAVGDRCLARILKLKKSYAYAKLVKLLEVSPHRCDADCSAFSQCGGCCLRHITYEAECDIKYNRVREVMHRIGGVDTAPQALVASKSPHRYRNKAQYPITAEGSVGFYAPRSHRIIPAIDCKLQPQEFTEASQILRKWINDFSVSVYNEQTHSGLLRHFYLRRGAVTRSLMAVLVANGDTVPYIEELVRRLQEAFGDELKSVIINHNTRQTNVILGDKNTCVYGSEYITDVLCGVKVRLSPFSFYQVNHDTAELLYSIAARYAEPQGKTVLDLYCGAGTIGLSMADSAKEIIGIEIVPAAIEDARQNAKENNIQNARFICADAAESAEKLKDEGLRPDVVILDPPRKGCDTALLRTVAEAFAPERIVYVSCDVATLARDTAELLKMGYELKEYTPVDMFPRTAHVETVALLSRQKVDEHIYFDVNVQDLPKTTRTTATYPEIKAYVKDKYGLNVTSLNIAQVKEKHGFEKRQNYNKGKDGHRVPNCPPEKEKAIEDAFKHFGML